MFLARMLRLAALTLTITAVAGGCASSGTGGASRAAPKLVTETLMIPAADAGIELHLRNRRPAGLDQFTGKRVVLFVHGATYPAETGFDIDLPGGSWLSHAAEHGYDAYILDVRGYGRSTRPKAMSEPANANPPFADTADAVKDVSAAVEYIRKRRGVDKINLVGWSWGTAIMGTYAAANNAKVERLVLYAPLYAMRESAPIAGAGAWRAVQREPARARSIRGIPENRVEEIAPRAWFDQWFDANLATDPQGAAQTPPVVRAPNGVIKDIGEFWGKGRSPYDPAAIRVPTMRIIGEWDQDTPLYMAQDVFAKMTNSPDKRFVILGEGTHAMVLEKHRMRLIHTVQDFLDE
jgi:pimeloyl-ACP methyl ester carboxylesterase